MSDVLLRAYTPLLLWTGLGLVLFRFLPLALPRLLGRALYWVGIPVEIFALARQTDFSSLIWLAPLWTGIALLIGMGLAFLSLQKLRLNSAEAGSLSHNGQDATPQPLLALYPNQPARQGSFVLCSMLGNTGFIGLAIATALISDIHLGWAVFYAITQNLLGTYGLGVFLSSYFGRSPDTNHWWLQLRDVLSVPSLWAFIAGLLSRPVTLPLDLESNLKAAIWIVIPLAFLLTGMRLSQLQGFKSLQSALMPALLKVWVLPLIVGLITTLTGLTGEPRLVLVLMSGMPTAFATLILAEEYDLDRELASSSIALSTILLLPLIPLWLTLFN